MWAIIIVAMLLAVYLLATNSSPESFAPCPCDNPSTPKSVTVLNPFIWPYSGTPCVDDLYMLAQTRKDDTILNTPRGPLTHLNSPDHVEFA